MKTDDRDVSTHFEYDALNRINRRWHNASSSTLDTTHNLPTLPSSVAASYEAIYQYDQGTYGKGRLSKSKNGYRLFVTSGKWVQVAASEYLNYDTVGRPELFRQWISDAYFDTSYVYNLSGGVEKMTYPSEREVKNTFLSNGDLSLVET